MRHVNKLAISLPTLEKLELGAVKKLLSVQLLIEEESERLRSNLRSDRGDVPGWVLVVLMTTGLVTAIWTIAAPKLSAILNNSLNNMNNIR